GVVGSGINGGKWRKKEFTDWRETLCIAQWFKRGTTGKRLAGYSTSSTSRIPNRFGTRCCPCSTGTLSIGTIRNERTGETTSRTIRQRIYKTQLFAMRSSGVIRQEERRILPHEDASQNSGGGPRRPVQPARVCSYTDFMKCQPLNFKGTEGVVGLSQRVEKMESVFHISGCVVENQVKFATCTLLGAALTWWNGHVRTLDHDSAYAMTWEILKKKLTDKYCPKGETKKLEIELWNLKVKGNDVGGYTQRFLELALMCTKFISNETEKVDKYINGLPDNIHGNVMSARPKTLDDAIELANDLMD
nr:reverse transcriptase domain-containing protein [Tanacetum cinerariifolium]